MTAMRDCLSSARFRSTRWFPWKPSRVRRGSTFAATTNQAPRSRRMSPLPHLRSSRSDENRRAVAVNPDGAVNTGDTPAPAESAVITVYLTGIGLTEHAGRERRAGALESSRAPTLGATASIGGQPAELLFLGLTPGFVGLAQAKPEVAAIGGGKPCRRGDCGGRELERADRYRGGAVVRISRLRSEPRGSSRSQLP